MDQPGSGYFDAAAGLPLHPVAAEAMQAAWADGWADPSRLTGAGPAQRDPAGRRPAGRRGRARASARTS